MTIQIQAGTVRSAVDCGSRRVPAASTTQGERFGNDS